MPHAVFDLPSVDATTEAQPRSLIPGVEPGGSQAGRPTKPALLIRDCWIEIIDINFAPNVGRDLATIFLKLSQETDMTPGLQLPIAQIGEVRNEADATGRHASGMNPINLFHAQGTVWAPRFVGVRVVELGTMTIHVDVHLDYEVVDVPWMDWFIMWDFLDNIVDNEREY